MPPIGPVLPRCSEAEPPRLEQAKDDEEQASRGQDGAGDVEVRFPTGPGRIFDLAGQEDDPGDEEDLQPERRPPANRAGDQAADERAGCRAQPAGAADHAEVLCPGLDVGEDDRDQDVDRRDHQRRADALEERVADGQQHDALGQQREHRADPVDDQAADEAVLAPPDVGQLAARNHQGGHRQREQRDRGLHATDCGVEVLRDRADRDVHVGGRVARDELRERQWQDHRPARSGGRFGRAGHRESRSGQQSIGTAQRAARQAASSAEDDVRRYGRG